MTTRLLVSVRSRAESLTVVGSAAQVIDIKEPSRGSLGNADVRVIQSIVDSVQGRRPVSVAFGELRHFVASNYASLPPVEFVKFGLAGCAYWAGWRQAWESARTAVPGNPQHVAVAYADDHLAGSPHWHEVLEAGIAGGCSILLLDTFDKSAGGLLDWYDWPQLKEVRDATARHGMRLALAGSLAEAQIRNVLDVRPDFIAVRTAACGGTRTGRISRACVDRIAQLFVESDSANALRMSRRRTPTGRLKP